VRVAALRRWPHVALGDAVTARLATRAGATPDPPAANALITVVACVASAVLVMTVPGSWHDVRAHWGSFLVLLAVTVALQLLSVQVYDRGAFSFAGSGMLAIGFTFGIGAAMVVGALLGIVQLLRRHGRINRGIFDSAQFALAAGAGASVYHAFPTHSTAGRLGPAVLAALAFLVLNTGLLSIAMGIAETANPFAVFRERFWWTIPYHAVSGPLALALVIAYERTGMIGVVAFAAPPALLMLSAHQYLLKTQASVEGIRQANDDLEAAVAALEERNADLKDLFEFTGGLSARAHDRATLLSYAQTSLAEIAGTHVRLASDLSGDIPLVAGGTPVGSLALDLPAEPGARWDRLCDVLLPQLATALESTALVDEVNRKHLATIAALSRSMEAKDYYTGGHTERVAQISVAIAQRLGFEGAELDAIEIGALLHDIGKIGIPEAILHKETELDEDEWAQMRQHPIISDYILSDLDVHDFVRQIARSSHERIDGTGYPDGLAGDEIPVPARIVLVADALDALTTDRPYRRARPLAAALVELREHTGTQLCPTVMAALERVLREQPQVVGTARLRAVTAVGAA